MRVKLIIYKKIYNIYVFFKKIFHYSYKNQISIYFAHIMNFILAYFLLKSLIWITGASLLTSEKDAVELIIPLIALRIIDKLGKQIGIQNLLKRIRQNIYTSVVLFFICFVVTPIKNFIINYLSWAEKKTQ